MTALAVEFSRRVKSELRRTVRALVPAALAVEFSRRVTMQDVVAAYRLFLHRPPDDEGYLNLQREVARGMSIERLTSIFMASEEFRQRSRSEVVSVEMAGGYSVCIDSKDTDFAPGILFNRDYETHVRLAITERLPEGGTFVDIGANVGCLTLLAAKLVGPTGGVFAIEPNPANLQRLYAGIALNGFQNIRVIPHAASDRREILSLSQGTSNTIVRPAGSFDSASVFTQSIVPDEELAHLPSIDIIKMDIEGHEPHALKGCMALIRKHNPILFTEFNPRCLVALDHDPMDYLEQMFTIYHRMHVITAWSDSAEFDEPKSIMAYWKRRNMELTTDGTLPDGMLHFDIIATN